MGWLVLHFFSWQGFGKGSSKFWNEWKDNILSLSDLLDNRNLRILNSIRNSEELHRGIIEQLEKGQPRLSKIKIEADQFQVNGYSEIEREKLGFKLNN